MRESSQRPSKHPENPLIQAEDKTNKSGDAPAPWPTSLAPKAVDLNARRKSQRTRDVHIRIPIHSYQYLNQLALRYGMRSLGSAVSFLIETHREQGTEPLSST